MNLDDFELGKRTHGDAIEVIYVHKEHQWRRGACHSKSTPQNHEKLAPKH
jgi:hypothetical protein